MLLAKSVGASRFVYNWGLAESQRAYESTGKRPKLSELTAQLPALKSADCAWLKEVSAHIGQSALKDLNVAFERFFKGVKGEGPKSGFPCFKRKGVRDSARLYEVKLEERHLRLPKIGRVRLSAHAGVKPASRKQEATAQPTGRASRRSTTQDVQVSVLKRDQPSHPRIRTPAAATLTHVSDYEYELRREDEIVATGRIQLEEAPAAGDSLRLGSHRVRIAEVLELGNGPRLILAHV